MLSYMAGTLIACVLFGTVTYYLGLQTGYEKASEMLASDEPGLDGETRAILDSWTED